MLKKRQFLLNYPIIILSMKILLLFNEENKAAAGEFRSLPETTGIPVDDFPIDLSEETIGIQKTHFYSLFKKPSLGEDMQSAQPTHVIILSALDPGWVDFLAGFSCGCQIPLLVYGKDAVKCVPKVFGFCFKCIDSTTELQRYLEAEYIAYKNIIPQKGSNAAREALLNMGVSVNEKSMVDCVNEGQVKEVSLFLDAGFSPDTGDKNGVPLLCLCARKGNLEMLQLLLRSGANVDQQAEDRRCSAVLDATMGKYKDIVKVLIEAGADVNIQSKDGQTALIVAAGSGDDETVEMLYKAGADPDLKDCLGSSARKYATLFGRSAMLALFNDPSLQKTA